MKIVIFVVGPQKVGKTVLANHLADLSESLQPTEYKPTQGVR
jgi:intraflagellar transport protein 22